MRLILAESANGFLASGPNDDMRWTGRTDKAIFQLLTMVDGGVCAVGSMSRRFVPELPGRTLITLSRAGYTLSDLQRHHPKAWLLGGPTIAEEASHFNLLTEAYICRSATEIKEPSGGRYIVTGNIMGLLKRIATVQIGDVSVRIYRRK